ncbi:unnamed protein product [marine sediment metagenome]|uniref:Uncharacterized protein n=1 Tax=marine sediment metagenome TaxID=412755 RepID=X1NJI1_9ZZZZ
MPEEKELEIKIKWLNNEFFVMEKKSQGGDWIKVVEIQENAHIAALAEHLKQLCLADITAHLDAIMSEMTAS